MCVRWFVCFTSLCFFCLFVCDVAVHMCAYVQVYSHAHTHTHTHAHTHIHTYIHTCIQTYIHTYIRTYIHAHARLFSQAHSLWWDTQHASDVIRASIHMGMWSTWPIGPIRILSVCTDVCIQVCAWLIILNPPRKRTHAYIQTYIHTYVHTYIHYIHTYDIHTYIYVCVYIEL
jgi:hypothetical protein